MGKIKATVVSATIGKFEVDSALIKIEDELIDVCFDKKVNVSQYDGKEVLITNTNGKFTIEADNEVKKFTKK